MSKGKSDSLKWFERKVDQYGKYSRFLPRTVREKTKDRTAKKARRDFSTAKRRSEQKSFKQELNMLD